MVINPTINLAFYSPSEPPTETAMIPEYLREEFRKISEAVRMLSDGHLEVTHVAPAKPRDGDIRLCDGTNWNPLGTGQKFVGYRGGAWILLG